MFLGFLYMLSYFSMALAQVVGARTGRVKFLGAWCTRKLPTADVVDDGKLDECHKYVGGA